MTASMDKLALFLICVAGCGPASHSNMAKPALPSLSLLDQADHPSETSPQHCHDGWLLTEVPHQAQSAAAILASDGTWHLVYGIEATQSLVTYGGIRAVSSADPTHSQSIAWAGSTAIAQGSEAAPTLFFSQWQLPGEAPSVWRARLNGATWQVDTQPVWSGVVGQSVGTMFAAIDGAGHAHVYLDLDGVPTVLSDASGKWVTTRTKDVVTVRNDSRLVTAFADQAGNDYIIVEPGLISQLGGGFLITNLGGSWRVIGNINRGIFLTDSKGAIHVIQARLDGIHDSLVSSGGAADQTIMAGAENLLAATYDRQGNLILALGDGGNPTHDALWSSASGSWQVTAALPLEIDSGAGLAFDGQHVRLAVAFATAGVSNGAGLGFLDPCP
jgi:hypothetical protein